jgi:hypothetical protein
MDLSIVLSDAAVVEHNDEQNSPLSIFGIPMEALINIIKFLKLEDIARFDSVL